MKYVLIDYDAPFYLYFIKVLDKQDDCILVRVNSELKKYSK